MAVRSCFYEQKIKKQIKNDGSVENLHMLSRFLKFLIGPTLPSEASSKERLSILKGMAVLSSDVISSVAYATDELLAVLIVGGAAALAWSMPVSLAIIGLLVVLVISYRQLIRAYPMGGGAYTVAKENLGEWAGLVAASGLLIDYVLTVSVSIAAGVAAVVSALPQLVPLRIELGILFLLIIMVGNLRGVREAGRIFSIPTILFVSSMVLLLAVGFANYFLGQAASVHAIPETLIGNVSIFLVLRAFASGCTALTGTETISNGVRIFKPPEVTNARRGMLIMGIVLGVLFLGITFLARVYGVVPTAEQTVVSQIARAVLGNGPLYYAIQFSTLLILIMAATTSFSGFPRVVSLLGHDEYLPRQLSDIGSRLVYSNGIVLLALLSGSLFIAFGGSVSNLIPLYAVGVFISFTLSQAGMVVHWHKKKGKDWFRSSLINATGTVLTAMALIIIAATKFTQGAWMIFLLVPLFLYMFFQVHKHYKGVADNLSLRDYKLSPLPRNHTIIVPISGVHRAVLEALNYARLISSDTRAIYVDEGDGSAAGVQKKWKKYVPDVHLIVLPSPERQIVSTVLKYVDRVSAGGENLVTVVIPEFVPEGRWGHLLHHQTASELKNALLHQRHVAVVSLAHHIE